MDRVARHGPAEQDDAIARSDEAAGAGPVEGEGKGRLAVADRGADQGGDAPVEGHRPRDLRAVRPECVATIRRAAPRRRAARLAASTTPSVIAVTQPARPIGPSATGGSNASIASAS